MIKYGREKTAFDLVLYGGQGRMASTGAFKVTMTRLDKDCCRGLAKEVSVSQKSSVYWEGLGGRLEATMFQEQPKAKKSLSEKLSRTWDKLAASKSRWDL